MLFQNYKVRLFYYELLGFTHTHTESIYLYTNKNKKQTVFHLLFPSQKGT